MSHETDQKAFEAMVASKRVKRRAELVDEARGIFGYSWRDAIPALSIGALLFGVHIASKPLIEISIASIGFDYIMRVNRSERRIDALTQLLVED